MANRRNILIGSGAAMVAAAAGTSVTALFGSSAALAQEQFDVAKLMAPAGGVPDHPLGNKDSKVTLIEYLSPTCPHCKAFLDDTFPALKAEYIDTNKIQFIPRPFVRNVLDAVVFMLAETAAKSTVTAAAPTAGDAASARRTVMTSRVRRRSMGPCILRQGTDEERDMFRVRRSADPAH